MQYTQSLICFEQNYCFHSLCQLHYLQVIFSDGIFLIAISSLKLVVFFFFSVSLEIFSYRVHDHFDAGEEMFLNMGEKGGSTSCLTF